MSLFTIISFLLDFCHAQIGINTEKPHKNSDLHLASPNKALILNKVSDFNAIDDPQDGMIVYDQIEQCFRGYSQGQWTNCFG